MMELIEWLQVKSALKQSSLALNASNIILIGYLIGFLINRKAVFITVFFMCEFLAYTTVMDSLPSEVYYLFFAGVYSTLYQYLLLNKASLKVLFWCGIIVLFNTGAILDVAIYPQTKTLFYKSYEFFVVFVHLNFIYAVINWRAFCKVLGENISRFACMLGAINTLSFIWYNVFIRNKQKT